MNTLTTIWTEYKQEHPSADKATFYAGAITAVNLLDKVSDTGGMKGRAMAKIILEDLAINSGSV